MAIIIQNIGGPDDGICKYLLRINQKVIAEFDHDRRDDLSVCLTKAATAAKKARLVEMLLLLSDEVE